MIWKQPKKRTPPPTRKPANKRAKPQEKQEAERIQKVLARSGVGSRRQVEQWISEGRIKVGGKVATLGERIFPGQKVSLDNNLLELASSSAVGREVIIYHKPVGQICSRAKEDRERSVFQHLPQLKQGRWISVGRLDVNTSGLLLFTTDGELANRLMHPSHQIEREYLVRVLGEVSAEHLKALREGVMLEDGPAKFNRIKAGGGEGANRWYSVTLSEGRNREVRRMWQALDIQVSKLKRIRYGVVSLPRELKPGSVAALTKPQLAKLCESVELI
jgi:23S rRNA pseudouridine2605 synthase|tara:strand:- start:1230 stop:2051 length:822 start_codon:yes stop_codon:yes gene_type:complete